MRLAIVDTETGLAEDSPICEFSVTVYKVGLTRRETGAITSFSSLLPVPENDAENINGISPELSQESEEFLQQSMQVFTNLVRASDYCVAFNAEFDKKRLLPIIGKQKWICAMTDLDWGFDRKNAYGGFRLIDLALWLGIGISTHHRAGDDVRLLVECLNRVPNILDFIERGIVRSKSPFVEVQALVNYDDRELAKKANFTWKPESKIWFTTIKECDLSKLANVPFQYKILRTLEA